MKAKINFEDFGGKISIENGDAIISSRDNKTDFSIDINEVRNKKFQSMSINPSSLGEYLHINIIDNDGWKICIEQDIYNPKTLIIIRYKSVQPHQIFTTEEYLTKKGQWSKKLASHNSLPNNALRIPLFRY